MGEVMPFENNNIFIKDHAKKKVLFLTLDPNLQGPLPKLAPLLINSLEKLGWCVTRSTWGRHSENENFYSKIIGRMDDIRKVLSGIARMKPNIMYVATTLDENALMRDIPLLLATFWSPVKKVMMMHGSKTNPLFKPGFSLYKLFTQILIRLSDAILLLSVEEVLKWERFYPKGIYYRVDNPFNIINTGELNSNVNGSQYMSPPTLLFVGRLIKEKGIFELLEAMPAILRQVNCRLLISGDGEGNTKIRQQIERVNLSQFVSLLGYLDSIQLFEIYRSSSVFILPSYREGFPNSIAEAMSFGLPIITTSVGGIPDHLKDGVNALFIKPRDPNAIASAVVRLLKDPKLRLKMHNANLKKIKEFIPENIVPKYVEIFSELINKDIVTK